MVHPLRSAPVDSLSTGSLRSEVPGIPVDLALSDQAYHHKAKHPGRLPAIVVLKKYSLVSTRAKVARESRPTVESRIIQGCAGYDSPKFLILLWEWGEKSSKRHAVQAL